MHIINDTSNRLNIVDQKFFISGHSYMSCDRDFGIIEKKKSSSQNIFVPNDWIQLVKDACKKKN